MAVTLILSSQPSLPYKVRVSGLLLEVLPVLGGVGFDSPRKPVLDSLRGKGL
jgi:hypothetical protein